MGRRQEQTFTKTLCGRFDFDPPPEVEWEKKSTYLLKRAPWQDLKASTREMLGLEAPLAVTQLRGYLLGLAPPQPKSAGEWIRLGRHGGSLPLREVDRMSTRGWIRFGPDCDKLMRLQENAQQLTEQLGLTMFSALTFLLTEEPVSLPWLSIQADYGFETSGSFTIHVGSAAVTAEDVREAYVLAKRETLGVYAPRQIKVDDLAVFMNEADAREEGLNWEESWQRWRAMAEEIGANPYADKTVYRNKVNDLRRRFPWIRDDLDSRARPTGRPRKAERGGESK